MGINISDVTAWWCHATKHNRSTENITLHHTSDTTSVGVGKILYVKRGSPFWKTTSLLLGGFCAQYDIENASTSSSGRQRIFYAILATFLQPLLSTWGSAQKYEKVHILRRIRVFSGEYAKKTSTWFSRILRRIRVFSGESTCFS